MQVSAGNLALCEVIRDRIARSPAQRLSFADYMALALYHPEHGYYTAQNTQLGLQGDFVTSTHLGGDFSELLAEQFVDMWQRLDCPIPFHLVEIGPGRGELAATVLAYLQGHHPACLAALHYTLVETSPALRQAQQARLASWQAQGVSLAWDALTNLTADSITGCLFSNELVDALPVHLVTLTEAGLQECYVTHTGDRDRPFTTVIAPLSTPALADYFTAADISLTHPPYPLGYTTEVNLAALEWMRAVARCLHRGYVMTIDYGYTADRYYRPSRSQGTLQCYYQQSYHNDPFIHVGQQDLTTHVDFTALERQGRHHGLQTLGTAPQELFLMALGLGDRLNELSQLQGTDRATLSYAIRRREALHQLIHPLGLGKFTILIQGKGLETPTQTNLKGLSVPPWHGAEMP